MALLLDGKTAIITGGASPRGIGRAIAQSYADQGARVAILDLDAETASRTATEIGAQHTGIACDVTDRNACEEAVSQVIAAWGWLDILVNNAGITQPLKSLDIAPDHYDAVLDVNLRGTLYMSQAAVPHMTQGGAIVNMSSVSAQRGGGIFGGPHYSAAKAGILGLTKAMAREFAPQGIRINAICPGFIATDITAGKLTDEMKADILRGIPMGRAGTAVDVAGCAVFLGSDLSAYCTGTEIDVNGGSLIH
ncbi:SDR family NAD(P)-dependent oxidoreductase [Paracoccus sp. Z330]|uniref:SDR family NAD(P)-dependent oxidoreductase n=1 Tax=Paracoccus onchidii TaxID=3017813 RepID=A0ABT4ZGH6_9RHOB|nr:SDR family NAD(P)-dependent oxidoreductase [Paracoccus onchidii]MDB6178465.1 SDR family NAD(P)-dependent oxidoreductase [Paracoccus onchidii]